MGPVRTLLSCNLPHPQVLLAPFIHTHMALYKEKRMPMKVTKKYSSYRLVNLCGRKESIITVPIYNPHGEGLY